MYKNWDEQKRKLIECISAGKSAVCQVCYGTNYAIFFRNLHADLLLKKNIIPIYVDFNYLAVYTLESFLSLVHASIKRTVTEKKISLRTSLEVTPQTLKKELENFVSELNEKNYTVVFFFEDFEKAKNLTEDILILFENLNIKYNKCVCIYETKINVSTVKNIENYKAFSHLYEELVYFPIKDEFYIKQIEKGTSPQMISTLYNLTGGIDKFFGVAIDLKNNLSTKERKNIKKHISSNWHLKQELNKLWNTFSEDETRTLSKIILNKASLANEDNDSVAHLLNLGILAVKGKKYNLTASLLRNTGFEKSNKEATIIDYKGDKVIVNGNKVSVSLSTIEKKLLKKLITNKNKIVGRRTMAKFILKDEARYNEILIDDVVLKLKNKLREAWVNPSNFVSVENKGFIYKEVV